MKRTLLYTFLLSTAVCLLAVCCSSENPVIESEPEDTDVMLCLNVSVSNTAEIYRPGTRATNPADSKYTFEAPAYVYERMNTLRVIIVRPDNTVEYNRLETLPATEGTTDFEQLLFKVATDQGVIDENKPNIRVEKKRIYLIANEASLPSEETRKFFVDLTKGSRFNITEVEDMIVSRPWATGAIPFIDNSGEGSKKFIPMTEFFDISVAYDVAKGNAGSPTQYESLFVTRIPVKFEFSVNGDASAFAPNESVRITAIRFQNVMEKEYLFPKDAKYSPTKYEDIEKRAQELTGRIITSFKTPGRSDNQVKPIEFRPESFGFGYGCNEDYAPQTYYCESENYEGDAEGNTTYFVSVDAAFVTDEGTEEIETFSHVALPNLPALPRNTVVKINFTFKNRDLLCDVTLFPYTAVNLNPTFGFGVPVESVHISIKTTGSYEEVSEAETAVGQTVSLVGYVLPTDANNQDIEWTSSDTNIATVSNKGEVTGVSAGTATITATSVDNPDIKATCEVTVNPKIPVTSLTMTPSTWVGNIGEAVNLVTSIEPEDATNKNIQWSSSDPSVASVSSYGTLTAINEGTATISATSVDNPDIKATCEVTVNPRVMVTSLTMSPTTMTLIEGGQSSLTATVRPQNATDQDLEWSSSAPAIATVSSYGLVTAVGRGTATITAKSKDGSDKSATCTVTVTAKTAVTSVTLSQSTWTTNVNTESPPQRTLTVTLAPINATYRNLRWTSSNPYVATVSGYSTTNANTGRTTGTVTAVNKGTAIITVTSVDDPTKSASCTVIVN